MDNEPLPAGAGAATPDEPTSVEESALAVSQQVIADILGLDRTTVNKVLNGHPSMITSKKTVESVIRVAKEMGYDFSRLRKKYKRKYERKHVKIRSEVEVYLSETGELYDRGWCTINNLTPDGALISGVWTVKGGFPLRPFTVKLRAIETDLQGVEGVFEVVRFRSNGAIMMGMRAVEMRDDHQQRIRDHLRI
ncbi:MAG: helix-turn-helix domain-containing protein [Nitrospirae bacterium]|nr:helix-turn-helix domain-containing protein [Nitrospirota bacterium]